MFDVAGESGSGGEVVEVVERARGVGEVDKRKVFFSTP